MIDNKTKLQNERDLISLLLHDRNLVDSWLESGPEIELFDDIHYPILQAITISYSENSLLTRRRFLDTLKKGVFSKFDKIAQEGLFNKINVGFSSIRKDDFVHLKSQIVEAYVTRNIVSYISQYKDNVTDKGGIFASKKLNQQISGLVSENEGEKKALFEEVRDVVPRYIKHLEEKSERGDEDVVTCGIKEIDYSMVVGFAPGTLTLFCGDVASHKSNMMLNIAVNIWEYKKKNVLVVPLEMPMEMWFQRMYSRETKIPFDRLEHPSILHEEEWKKIRETHKKWDDREHKFYIMEAPDRIPISYLRREIEKHIDIFKPDIVVVDYIANLIAEKGAGNNRPDLIIGDILKGLIQMGRPGSVGIHKGGFSVVSAAQIGREGLKRIRKQGVNKSGFYSEDLRGSHEYSADAANIYAQMGDPNDSNRLFFYVIKNRYGKGMFSNNSNRTVLNVQGAISLIEGENNDWIDDMKQGNILMKVEDSLDDFDPMKDADDNGDKDEKILKEEQKIDDNIFGGAENIDDKNSNDKPDDIDVDLLKL